jgi:hypothetical protein
MWHAQPAVRRSGTSWEDDEVELGLFDEVAEAVRGLLPDELGEPRMRTRRYSLKVWFGPLDPPREHYEAQVVGADLVDGAEVLALEVGFHAEHYDVARNEQILSRLNAHEGVWRPVLGDHAVAGGFLGRPDDWRRLSETWPDPDLSVDDVAVEVASCLVDYITVIEPLRVDS